MAKLYLSSLGFRICIVSERKRDIDYLLENSAMFSSIVVGLRMGRTGRNPDLTITIEPVNAAIKIRFDDKNGTVIFADALFDKLRAGGSLFDFVFFTVVLFERLYERKGIYGLWSAGFVRNRKAFLILANSNGGKSNIVARLSHDFGCRIIGDDRVVLASKGGKAYAIGGNDTLSFRSGSVPGWLSGSVKLERDGKLRAKPGLIGTRKFKGTAPLKSIFIVSISGKRGVNKLNASVLKRCVYGNISRVLGASEFSFIDSLHGFPHLDTPKLRKARFDFVSQLDGIGAHELHGSVDSITREIARLSRTK